MKRVFLFLFLFLNLNAAEPKKYTLSVCAIFKNESPYLKEWIEYHKLIGIDHFYLYNLGSLDGFKKTLSPYIRAKIVTLVQWNDPINPTMNDDLLWVLSTQIPAYENAARWKAIRETEWLVFLDIDEFLVPRSEGKITEILKKYKNDPAIVLPIEYYDASARGTLPQRKLVIEATEIAAAPPPKLRKAIEKTIFKPEMCTVITWPPYHYEYKEGKKAAKIGKDVIQINRYENRMQFQRLDKVKLKLPVQQDSLSESQKLELLKSGYEIEDSERAIYRFVPDLYKQLGISVGSG